MSSYCPMFFVAAVYSQLCFSNQTVMDRMDFKLYFEKKAHMVIGELLPEDLYNTTDRIF